MAGWLTDGVPTITVPSGLETFNVDTNSAGGANPQTGAYSIAQLANLISFYGNGLDKTMVSGSRYFSSFAVGTPAVLTGISVRIGTTGGTDSWIVELHGPTGLLLATSALAGTTAGTASTWQNIPFTATYNLTVPGTYFLALQSNGTTAKFDSLNAPTNPGVLTGSATGVFGTGASITPPTTYTANLGPKAQLY
jgi:hypothetical protein